MENGLDTSLRSLARAHDPAIETVRDVAREVQALGGRAFLVGGCVRDALLGRPCHDFDLEIHGVDAAALERAVSRKWPLDNVGAVFGVLKLKGAPIDISLPRRENRLGAGHRDFAIAADPALPPEESVKRRDFTVNAVMADALTLEIVDPAGGIDDLRAGRLRQVSSKFAEDPLRVLRGMQFLARFPFLAPDPGLVATCAEMSQEALPRERLAAEWEKLLLQGIAPSRGLAFLRACGWLAFYPELLAMVGCPQDPVYHPEGDVWVHTLMALDASVRLRAHGDQEYGLAMSLAALCHDMGKPAVTAVGAEDGRLHAYNHEVVGVAAATTFVRRLWNRDKLAATVAKMVASHMRPISLAVAGAGPKAYRRLAVEAGRLDMLADVVECDVRATTAPGRDPDSHPSLALVREFREKCAALAIEKAPPKPMVQGRDLIARGLSPGPEFGPLLEKCYEAQLAGEIRDAASAAAFLDALLKPATTH